MSINFEQMQGDDSVCRIRRRFKRSWCQRSSTGPENSPWRALCHLETRRLARILQRITASDPEDRAKLSVALDDKGEDLEVHMGCNACATEISASITTAQTEDRLKHLSSYNNGCICANPCNLVAISHPQRKFEWCGFDMQKMQNKCDRKGADLVSHPPRMSDFSLKSFFFSLSCILVSAVRPLLQHNNKTILVCNDAQYVAFLWLVCNILLWFKEETNGIFLLQIQEPLQGLVCKIIDFSHRRSLSDETEKNWWTQLNMDNVALSSNNLQSM